MIHPTLSQTLTALADGATPDHPGMVIETAEIDLPLLVRFDHGPDGPVFTAHPPFSAYQAGFEPVAHRAHIRIQAVDPQGSSPVTRPAPDPVG